MFISLFLFFNILRRKFASVHVGLEWAKEKLYILYHVMVPVIVTLLFCLLITKCSYGYVKITLTYLGHQALRVFLYIFYFKS